MTSKVNTAAYQYYFNFTTPPDLVIANDTSFGIYHGLDIVLISRDQTPQDTPSQIAMVKWLRKAWASFAKDPE